MGGRLRYNVSETKANAIEHKKSSIEIIGDAMTEDFARGIETGLKVSHNVFNTGDGQGVLAWAAAVASGTILGGAVGWCKGLSRGIREATQGRTVPTRRPTSVPTVNSVIHQSHDHPER